MSRPKHSVINEMRKVAAPKFDRRCFSDLLALASSLEFFHTFFSDMASVFIKIICRPENFRLTYEELEPVCNYSEKTLRAYCKKFAATYLSEKIRFRSLPLPLLIAHFFEFDANHFLHFNIPALRTFNAAELEQIIETFPATTDDRRLGMLILTSLRSNFRQEGNLIYDKQKTDNKAPDRNAEYLFGRTL